MSSLPPPNDQAAGDRGDAAFAALVSPTNRQSNGHNRGASSASSLNNVALFNDDLEQQPLEGDPSNADNDHDDSNGSDNNGNIFNENETHMEQFLSQMKDLCFKHCCDDVATNHFKQTVYNVSNRFQMQFYLNSPTPYRFY